MRCFALPSILACSLALAAVPQGALAAAPSKGKAAHKKKGKKPADDGGAEVPEPAAGDAERVGRVFIDADGLGDAGPVLAGRTTRLVEGAFEAEKVTLTDAPAGPELRVTLSYRDSGGYQVAYEIDYNGAAIEDGSGSFECQLCTEDELIEKVEALARQVAPKMMVPKKPEEDPKPEDKPDPEIVPDNGGAQAPVVDEDPGKLRRMGKAGVGFLVVGGLTTVSGIVLAAITPPELEIEPAGVPEVRGTRQAGYGVLAGGVVMVVVGAVLLGVDRKRAKRRASQANVSLDPWFHRDGGGLGVSGRF